MKEECGLKKHTDKIHREDFSIYHLDTIFPRGINTRKLVL